MNKSNFLKDCMNKIAEIDVKSESQAIAKEVVLETLENYETQLQQKDNAIDECIEIIKDCFKLMPHEFDWGEQATSILKKLQQVKGDSNE